jgi:ornithine cyclodeaminase
MTGALSGIIVGDLIGELRTGAIGGVAVKHMARPDSQILGIIGSGPQARAQLEAAASVLSFQKVTVFSRTAEKRERFAAEMSEKLAIEVRPASSPEEAVREADVLICATSSGTPVFKAEWLKAGVHINTIGPKFTVAHEIEIQVADRSRVIATDSLEQVNAYHPAFFLSDTPHRQRVVELGDIVAGAESGRTSPEDVTLFCSVGLAGTEVVVAAEVIRRLKSND